MEAVLIAEAPEQHGPQQQIDVEPLTEALEQQGSDQQAAADVAQEMQAPEQPRQEQQRGAAEAPQPAAAGEAQAAERLLPEQHGAAATEGQTQEHGISSWPECLAALHYYVWMMDTIRQGRQEVLPKAAEEGFQQVQASIVDYLSVNNRVARVLEIMLQQASFAPRSGSSQEARSGSGSGSMNSCGAARSSFAAHRSDGGGSPSSSETSNAKSGQTELADLPPSRFWPDRRCAVTTLMVYHVPTCFTQQDLVERWQLEGSYNFLYLCNSPVRSCRLRIAIIDFVNSQRAIDFRQRWQGYVFEQGRPQKPLAIVASSVPGRDLDLKMVLDKALEAATGT